MKYQALLDIYEVKVSIAKRLAKRDKIQDITALKQLCFDWYTSVADYCLDRADYLEPHHIAEPPVLEGCEYIRSYWYRGEIVHLFLDDCGQQYVFIFMDETYSCGAYNLAAEEEMMYIVDKYLDDKMWED